MDRVLKTLTVPFPLYNNPRGAILPVSDQNKIAIARAEMPTSLGLLDAIPPARLEDYNTALACVAWRGNANGPAKLREYILAQYRVQSVTISVLV